MTRVATVLVSLLGSLGLALALGYLLLVFRAFQPGGASVTAFLIGASDGAFSWGFAVFLVPYALLLAHMWLRIRLGDWLLERGAVDEALKYAERRMKPTLLRSRREALAHRAVAIRVYLRRLEYQEANRLIGEVTRFGRPNVWQTKFRRWQLETALRTDDLVSANAVIREVGALRERSAEAAALLAASAEVAIREGDADAAQTRLEASKWADRSTSERREVAEAMRAATFERDEASLREALAALGAAEHWLRDIPGATGELTAWKARVTFKLGEREAARAMLDAGAAQQEPADQRSQWFAKQVRSEVDDEQTKDGSGHRE